MRRPAPEHVWPDIVIVGCSYEIAALVSKRVPGPTLPTISQLVQTTSTRNRVGLAAALAWCFAWTFHCLDAATLFPTPEATGVVPR